jgi:hypothetical protein
MNTPNKGPTPSRPQKLSSILTHEVDAAAGCGVLTVKGNEKKRCRVPAGSSSSSSAADLFPGPFAVRLFPHPFLAGQKGDIPTGNTGRIGVAKQEFVHIFLLIR